MIFLLTWRQTKNELMLTVLCAHSAQGVNINHLFTGTYLYNAYKLTYLDLYFKGQVHSEVIFILSQQSTMSKCIIIQNIYMKALGLKTKKSSVQNDTTCTKTLKLY